MGRGMRDDAILVYRVTHNLRVFAAPRAHRVKSLTRHLAAA
jgi:hypothetical protein